MKVRVEKIGPSSNLWVWHISCVTPPPRLDSQEWEAYKQLPPGLIIFDTLRASHLSDENKSNDMAVILARLKELREMGFTIVLLHHSPKGNDGVYKGSTAILDLADHVLALEKEQDTEEFSIDTVYRLGTRIKTRYEPYTVFLTFNPEIKGFELRKDPDMEKMEQIACILRDSGEPMKQKVLKDRIKDDLGFSEKDIRRLLQKGADTFWSTKRGDKNSLLFSVCSQFVCLSDTYISEQTDKQDLTNKNDLAQQTSQNILKTVDNTELVSLSGASKQTGKQNIKSFSDDQAILTDPRFIDGVKTYIKMGLTQTESEQKTRDTFQEMGWIPTPNITHFKEVKR